MSDLTEPLVGIALAAYKPDIDYFAAQLESIVQQTYRNWFCVVGFDSDLSQAKAQPALKIYLEDSRFLFVQNTGSPGASSNFQTTGLRCLEEKPRYIAFSDQDDVWYPTKTARLVEELQMRPPLSLVHCDMNILKQERDSFVAQTQTAWKLERRGVHNNEPLDYMIRNIAAGAGMLIDAELIRRHPEVHGDAFSHDHWFALIASFYGGVYPVETPLYAYRIHTTNIAGVSEYQGFFAASKSSARDGFIHKCMMNYNVSRKRCDYALAEGLPVKKIDVLTTTLLFDFGFLYLVKTLRSLTSDPAIARAALTRALGKLLRIFHPGYTNYAAM